VESASVPNIVFLLDVDNTLLDNDRFGADLGVQLTALFGAEQRARYAEIDRGLRGDYGYADYLTTLQRFRDGLEGHPRILDMSDFLLEYPFKERVFPRTFEALAHLRELGRPVILSDGDVVFQPRKVRRSGLWDAVEGRVLIYVHKERMLDDVLARYRADHYVMVDDKLHLLVAMKAILGARLTTVFVRQGHYAAEAASALPDISSDIVIEHIGDLCDLGLTDFLPDQVGDHG
jgi:FMN phosphatase YigB (HAD superfamily)